MECDAEDHKAELQQARRMIALQPQCPASLGALRHAAWCNGLEPLARQATVALRRMEGRPDPVIRVAEPAAAAPDMRLGQPQR